MSHVSPKTFALLERVTHKDTASVPSYSIVLRNQSMERNISASTAHHTLACLANYDQNLAGFRTWPYIEA